MEQSAHTSLAKPRGNSRYNLIVSLLVGAAVAGAGLYLLVSRAAGPFVTVNAAQLTPSGSASIVTDPTVGSALAFGSGSVGTATCTYPNPDCTGIPATTVVSKTVQGDFNATTAGQVIDGWHITGNLNIQASNVTVKNSQIDGTIDNETGPTHYGPFTVADTTIGPASGCVSLPGIGESNYTATRVLIRGHDDGFRMSGNDVTVTDSYAHLCWNPPSIAPPDGSHSDGFQNYCKDSSGGSSVCINLTFNHNTIDEHDIAGNSAVNAGSNADGSKFGTVTMNDNLFWGGGYTVVTQWGSGPIWTIHNNRFVDKGWQYAPVDAEGTCANQDWAGNSIVTVDAKYNITSTVRAQGCIQ